MKVAVVIPYYKAELTKIEKQSFEQCLKILKNYDKIFALPEGLEIKFNTPSLKTEWFKREFFQNIAGYNKLMLSPGFYERFLEYDYILIYQLDSFVFRDELDYWCNKNYDYIGAPWIATKTLLSTLLEPFASKSIKKRAPIFYKVGNGGFSLRKTETFFKISKELKKEINIQLEEKKGEIYCNEDVFWSLKAPKFYPDFAIPGYEEAVKFAIDRKPDIALKINNNELPFGCHGIDKPKVVKFWAPIIEKEYQKTNL